MSGAIALRGGVVWVARERRGGLLRAYDLDGRPLSGDLVVPPAGAARTSITGLAVDDDRRILVVDGAAGAVRLFSPFGTEQPALCRGAGDHVDAHAAPGVPVDVAVDGVERDERVLVGSGGERRHALHLLDRAGDVRASLRPFGDPLGVFQHVRKVALRGRLACALEDARARVQVFRDGEFHFAFGAPERRRDPWRPAAVEPLGDGRFVLAVRGARSSGLVLLDRAGGLERALAADGELEDVVDLVVEEGGDDRATRIAVLDQDGVRVQVFTLQGACLGEFVDATA